MLQDKKEVLLDCGDCLCFVPSLGAFPVLSLIAQQQAEQWLLQRKSHFLLTDSMHASLQVPEPL